MTLSQFSPYRDSSPGLPLSPTGSINQWLLSRKSRYGFLIRGRVRLLLIATTCVLLGWMMTLTLDPTDQDAAELDSHPYDVASGGVLSDPSGYGRTEEEERPQGIGANDDAWSDSEMDKKMSVSGALSELHQAVSDKLQGWSPYHPTPSSKTNKMAGTKDRPKPTNSTTALSEGEYVSDGISEADRLGARTRIGKCTILFNGNSFWERAIRTHEEHDRLHGYRLHVLRNQLVDDVWSKPAYILSLLLRELAKSESERLEWLFWVDADTIILNPKIPIEVFLPPPGTDFEDTHFIYSKDWNGLNNGVFPVRVNQWSVQLFSAITSFRHYRPEEPLVFRDQSAMNILMHETPFSKSIVQAPQRWFNAYQGEHNETLAPYQVRRGDLLVHFAGVSNRDERMGYWLDRAEQHLDDWEVPVKSTSYMQEARDFWAEQRVVRQQRAAEVAEVRDKATALLRQTDQRLSEFRERLTEEQIATIDLAREGLTNRLNDARFADDITAWTAAMDKLMGDSQPLDDAVAVAHRTMLASAREAIFGGERDLYESKWSPDNGHEDSLLSEIYDRIQKLKAVVMAPEEEWNRDELTGAMNALTEVRAALQGRKADKEAQGQEEAARKMELEQASKAVLAEAAVGGVSVEVVRPVAVVTILGAIVTGPDVTVTVMPTTALG